MLRLGWSSPGTAALRVTSGRLEGKNSLSPSQLTCLQRQQRRYDIGWLKQRFAAFALGHRPRVFNRERHVDRFLRRHLLSSISDVLGRDDRIYFGAVVSLFCGFCFQHFMIILSIFVFPAEFSERFQIFPMRKNTDRRKTQFEELRKNYCPKKFICHV